MNTEEFAPALTSAKRQVVVLVMLLKSLLQITKHFSTP